MNPNPVPDYQSEELGILITILDSERLLDFPSEVLDIVVRKGKVKEFVYCLIDILPPHAKLSTEELIFTVLRATRQQIALAARRTLLPLNYHPELQLALEREGGNK